MNKSILMLFFIITLSLAGCSFSDNDINNNLAASGDINFLENFSNLSADNVEFIEGEVYEYQFDIETVWESELGRFYDINNNGIYEQCFTYKLDGFNLKVDSVEAYTSNRASITLMIYAIAGNNIKVLETTLDGLSFPKPEEEISIIFDDDINEFLYSIKIFYDNKIVNSFDLKVDVNGMVTERDWSDFHD